jgi:uncharacterized iron-regulated protein
VSVSGGDLAREQVRRIGRDGDAAVPPELAALLSVAPLNADQQNALDADLLENHCGQLPEARVPAMRRAQRVRDASLWAALREAQGKPRILVAGNGHVRLDYGVPRLIAAWQPAAQVVSVAFVEPDTDVAALRGLYTHAWITAAPAARDDPCAGVVIGRAGTARVTPLAPTPASGP